jgi:hypothetical protein
MIQEDASSKYMSFLKEYLSDEALAWVYAYIAYCHCVDDVIDKDKPIDNDFILKTFRLSILVYSSSFYQQNVHLLRPLVETVHDSYRDSVIMERSDEHWSRSVADVIRQNANDVILFCILITSTLDKRNEAAIRLRELAYNTQHD